MTRRPPALPGWSTPGLVLLGVLAMMKTTQELASLTGLRPTLLFAEAALVAPALGGATLWVTSLGLFETQYAVWRPPPGYLEAFRRLHDALHPEGAVDVVASVLAIAIAPAVCEELLFRGLVLPSLLGLGAAGAVAGSAALFGLIHLDFTPGPNGTVTPSLYRVPFACVIGVALAVLRLRTRSLLPGVVAHAVLNTITFVAAPLTDDPTQGLPESRPLFGLSLLAAGALASALLFRSLGDRRLTRGADST